MVIASNRKAYHNFEIHEKFEAGVALVGTEVKAIRLGKVNLGEGWVMLNNGEAFLENVQIGQYAFGNRENHLEKRSRKLLLHKNEILKLECAIEQKGFTVLPLRLYFKKCYVKLEIGVARGKKQHDKRQATEKREADRQMERALKRKNQ